RAELHGLLGGAAVDRWRSARAILFGDVFRQFYLDLENVLVAVFRVYNVVLRQADVLRGNVAGVAVHLHKVGCAHGGRGQEVVKRAGRRAVAFVADGLVGDDGEIVKFGLKPQVVEIIDFDFHGQLTGFRNMSSLRGIDEVIPDARDGLTKTERTILYVLSETQKELGDRNVPTVMLYGRVLEYVNISEQELHLYLD